MELLFTKDGRRITTGQPFVYQGNSSRVMKLWDQYRYYDDGLYRSPQQPVCNCMTTQFNQFRNVLKDPSTHFGWVHQKSCIAPDYNMQRFPFPGKLIPQYGNSTACEKPGCFH